MRMMMIASIPHEPFNSLVRNNTAGALPGRILEDLKPEAAYFMEEDGKRCAKLVIDIADPSQIPRFSGPFFLSFNADCRFRVVMSADDLGRAGLGELGRKW